MNRYESSSLSEVLIERMENFVSSALAKKDQLMLAQCFKELELEKRHHEEISKIREEQLKMMLSLLQAGGLSSGVGLTEQQQQEMLDNLNKAVA